MSDVVLRVDGLTKTFTKPFSRRKVRAVKGVSFEVLRGEVFGFLGPNGAGKTTTIKMLTGLIHSTGGSASLEGVPLPSPAAMAKVGFMPENPYIYPYLTPREFVTLCGRLSGMSGRSLFARVEEVIARVGIAQAIDRPVRALSKGMLQRTGLAAALVHGPELLILDEPMSGLDPVGRKEVRDLIVEERRAGRTIFFSSHILSDVELLCDRVAILREGELVVSGALKTLLASGARRTEIHLTEVTPLLREGLVSLVGHVKGGALVREVGAGLVLEVLGEDAVRKVLEQALAQGARVESLTPKRETLEEVFVRRAL